MNYEELLAETHASFASDDMLCSKDQAKYASSGRFDPVKSLAWEVKLQIEDYQEQNATPKPPRPL